MGKLTHPDEIHTAGPWLLDYEALEALKNTLSNIEKSIEAAYQKALQQRAEEMIDQRLLEPSNNNSVTDISKIKEKIANSYEFSTKYTSATIRSKDNKKYTENSLEALLKDPAIEDFRPEALSIEIRRGPCQFKVAFSDKRLFSDELLCQIQIEDESVFNNTTQDTYKAPGYRYSPRVWG